MKWQRQQISPFPVKEKSRLHITVQVAYRDSQAVVVWTAESTCQCLGPTSVPLYAVILSLCCQPVRPPSSTDRPIPAQNSRNTCVQSCTRPDSALTPMLTWITGLTVPSYLQGCELWSPDFLWDSNSNSGPKKTWIPSPSPKSYSDSNSDLLCDILLTYFKDDLREILNSCNKRCTIVYNKHSGMMTGHTWGSMTGRNCTSAKTV